MRRMKEGGPFCCPLSVASRLLRARCIISCTFCVAFVGKDRRASTAARAFSDRNESVGIPKTARVRFKLDAGEGGQHA